MKSMLKTALILGTLALATAPATALAVQPADVPPSHAGAHYQPAPQPPTPGPVGNPGKAKAYGFYCNQQGASKEHVKGQQGTEFSRCVRAMARADKQERIKVRKACKDLSKKHVKGEKGTPFSRCVVAAAQLRKDERELERQQV